MLANGAALNKRYKIIELIGSGGTANVYLAEDLILNRQVAVKVLRYDGNNNERAIQRFQREARAISELTHENIVALYDVDTDGEYQYLVMEHVEGTDLKKYIRQNYPLPLKKVIEMMQQITKAVSAAHKKGIIHRDLKPQNILIRHDGQVKITDFGIATGINDIAMTQTNMLVGSIHYLSPEQARGKSATHQSDIYALGIMMYELIVGNVPFNGDTPVSIAMQHFQQQLPSVIANAAQNVPQSVENVILKATAKLPENRYAHVEEMYFDLTRALLVSNYNVAKYVEPVIEKETTVKPSVSNSNQQTTPHQQPTVNNRKKWVVFGSVVVALLTVVAVTLMFLFNMPKDVVVPSVSGLSQVEATKILTDAQLIVDNVIYREDKKVAKNKVISVAPDEKTTVKSKTKVTLVVSSGYSGEEIGDYKQLPYDQVEKELNEKGLIVEKKTQASTTVNEGLVISQSIPAGTKITTQNKVITLTVSSGALSIQDYTNKSFDSVKGELESKGVKVQKSDEKFDDNVAVGHVVSQSIAPNTKVVPENTTLAVVVSLGKPVVVDNYVNENAQLVKQQLENKLVKVVLVEQESDSVPNGHVIAQSVPAGTTLAKNSTITLTISKEKIAKMPNLLGSSQAFAQLQLNALNVNVVIEYNFSSTYAKGTVFKQSVKEGAQLTKNQTVTITISKGAQE